MIKKHSKQAWRLARYKAALILFFYLFPFAPLIVIGPSTPYFVGLIAGAGWIFVSIPAYRALFEKKKKPEQTVREFFDLALAQMAKDDCPVISVEIVTDKGKFDFNIEIAGYKGPKSAA